MNIETIKPLWRAYMPLVLASIAYLIVIFEYGINVPIADDYHQQLARIIKLQSGELTAFEYLFNLHNGHRIFTTMFFSLMEYLGLGSINFKTQLIVGGVFFVALSFALVSFSKKENRLGASIICCLILLVPNYSASMWLGGSTPYYALVLFGVLSLKLLPRINDKRYLLSSILCSFLAIYSLLSGFLVVIVAVVFLLFCQNRVQRSSKLYWIASNFIFLLLYFQNYRTNALHPSVFSVFDMPVFTLEFAGQFLSGFWVYLLDQVYLSILTLLAAALFMWVIFFKIGFKKFLDQDLSLALLYLVLLSASIVAGRVGFESLDITVSAKYFVITKSLWILAIYLLFDTKFLKPRPAVLLMMPLLGYFIYGYTIQFDGIKDNQRQLSQGIADTLFSDDDSKLRHPKKAVAKELLRKAIDLNLYSPELLTSDQIYSSSKQRPLIQSMILPGSYSIKQAHGYVVIEFELRAKPKANPIVSVQNREKISRDFFVADKLLWSWGRNSYRAIYKTTVPVSPKLLDFTLMVVGEPETLDFTLEH